MTMTSTKTQSTTYSIASTRHVNDKIASDLGILQLFNPDIFTEEDVHDWKADSFIWIQAGYASTVSVQFIKNGTVTCEVKWSVSNDSSVSTDDVPGGLMVKLAGTKPRLLIEPSAAWQALSTEEKASFYRKLSPGWGDADTVPYAAGLSTTEDKQYVHGTLGVQRSVRR